MKRRVSSRHLLFFHGNNWRETQREGINVLQLIFIMGFMT